MSILSEEQLTRYRLPLLAIACLQGQTMETTALHTNRGDSRQGHNRRTQFFDLLL